MHACMHACMYVCMYIHGIYIYINIIHVYGVPGALGWLAGRGQEDRGHVRPPAGEAGVGLSVPWLLLIQTGPCSCADKRV